MTACIAWLDPKSWTPLRASGSRLDLKRQLASLRQKGKSKRNTLAPLDDHSNKRSRDKTPGTFRHGRSTPRRAWIPQHRRAEGDPAFRKADVLIIGPSPYANWKPLLQVDGRKLPVKPDNFEDLYAFHGAPQWKHRTPRTVFFLHNPTLPELPKKTKQPPQFPTQTPESAILKPDTSTNSHRTPRQHIHSHADRRLNRNCVQGSSTR